MHDGIRVRVLERVGQLLAGAQHLRHREPALGRRGRPLGERATRHEAGDDQERAVLLDRVVDGHDPRVVAEPRHQPGLAPDPLACGVVASRIAQARDRHGPVQRQVVGEPHVLGAAAAEQPLRHVAAGDRLRVARPGGHDRLS
jgi:hypothetical protein